MPKAFDYLNLHTVPCTIALNSTHLMVLGYSFNEEQYITYRFRKVSIVNWQEQKWTELSPFPGTDLLWGCQATLTKDKSLQTEIYASCVSSFDFDYVDHSHVNLMTYKLVNDLSSKWFIVESSLISYKPIINPQLIAMFSKRGSLFVITSFGTMVEYNLKSSDVSIKTIKPNSTLQSVIPYYA